MIESEKGLLYYPIHELMCKATIEGVGEPKKVVIANMRYYDFHTRTFRVRVLDKYIDSWLTVFDVPVSLVKPMLRPLHDITKEVSIPQYNEGRPFTPLFELNILIGEGQFFSYEFCVYHTQLLPISVIQLLIGWHFWVFDQSLFNRGVLIKIKEVKK